MPTLRLRDLAWKLTLPLSGGLWFSLVVLGLVHAASASPLPFNPTAPWVGETCFATPNNGTTVYSSTNASAVQSATDAAAADATVKIAGTCAGVQARGGTTQTVYV